MSLLISYFIVGFDLSASSAGLKDKELLRGLLRSIGDAVASKSPLNKVAFLAAADGTCTVIKKFEGTNGCIKIDQITEASIPDPSGDFSASNLLAVALSMLKGLPRFINKEVHVLTCSTSTIDSRPVSTASFTDNEISVSFYSRVGDVYYFRDLADRTRGAFIVSLTDADIEADFQKSISSAKGAPAKSSKAIEPISIAFPARRVNLKQSICIW